MNSHETASSGSTRTSRLEPLLTVDGVCRLLGVSKPSVYRLIRAGELRPIRVGGSTRFAPDDVREFVERNREEAQ